MFALRAWLLMLVITASALSAAAAAPLGEVDARHLLGRTGLGVGEAVVSEFSMLSRDQAIERLLADTHRKEASAPAILTEYLAPAEIRAIRSKDPKQLQRMLHQSGAELRAWWATELLTAPTPADQLRERMTLFWHNHFVSSIAKVKSASLMLEQNRLLRHHAAGHFDQMLHRIAKDPAMLIHLDSATNRRESPNENFAREVMELFTLGEGHYTEQDVKEAARAFTGWSIDPQTGRYLWRRFAHDGGDKVVLGQRGNFDGDAVLDILLQQPATAEFVTRKLWREFVSPIPDEDEVTRIARRFRESSYDIRVVLSELLSSPAFWAAVNRNSLIKSPVDFVVGSLRTREVEIADPLPVALELRRLGQDLFAPPNVRGWPGGETWINSTTLLARKHFIERMTRRESELVIQQQMLDPAFQVK